MAFEREIVTEGDIRRIALGSLVHITIVSILFCSSAFLDTLIRQGYGNASERLSMTTQRLLDKLGPIFDRFERLYIYPDDYGFKLYSGLDDSRYYPTFGPDPTDSPRPTRRPTRKPTATAKPTPTEDLPSSIRKPLENLIAWVKTLKKMDKKTREKLIERAKPLTFREVWARKYILLIGDIDAENYAEEVEKERLTFFREFFLLRPKGLSLHLTKKDLEFLTSRYSYAQLCIKIEDGGLNSLKKLFPKATRRPTQVASATATARPTRQPLNPKTLTAEDYNRLERNENIFQACVAKQNEISKAHERFKKASLNPVTDLNVASLLEMGFLHTSPECPVGGSYYLDKDGKIYCTTHGSAADPHQEHQQYLVLFKRYNTAKEAYVTGKYREALFHVEKIVRDHPNHNQALELKGLCQMHLRDWKAAGTTLKAACRVIEGDAQLYFYTANCFYAAGNRTLAAEHYNNCLRAKWETSQRSLTRPKEFHLLKDEAKWTLKFVTKLKYLDFKLEQKPTFPSEICEKRLIKIRDYLNKIGSEYFETQHMKVIKGTIRRLKRELSELREFEDEERERVKAELDDAQAKLRRRLQGTGPGTLIAHFEDKILDGTTLVDFCPDNERYFIDPYGNVDCRKHRRTLVDASLSAEFRLTQETRAILNEILARKDYHQRPDLIACYSRQRSIVGRLRNNVSPDGLEKFRQSKRFKPGDDTCPTCRKMYEAIPPYKEANYHIINCPVHGSYEKFITVPEGKYGAW